MIIKLVIFKLLLFVSNNYDNYFSFISFWLEVTVYVILKYSSPYITQQLVF